MNKPTFKFGCDPELFLTTPDNIFVSAHPYVAGTKKAPHKLRGGASQLDGTAVEINIDPAEDVDTFVQNIADVKEQIENRLPPRLKLTAAPTALFKPIIFQAIPQQALVLGCDPDFNAWNDGCDPNPIPNHPDNVRVAGGHIHIGWTEGQDIHDPNHLQRCVSIIKQLDYYLGLATFSWDQDRQRRRMYGQAGSFRPKSYGVEYRTPSNAWLKEERLIRRVFNLAKEAVDDMLEGKRVFSQYGDLAQTLINECNETEALKLHASISNF